MMKKNNRTEKIIERTKKEGMADLKPRIILLERVPPKLESFFSSFLDHHPFFHSREITLWVHLIGFFLRMFACSAGQKCPPESECLLMNRQRKERIPNYPKSI